MLSVITVQASNKSKKQHFAYLSVPVYLLIFADLAGTGMQGKGLEEISTSFVLLVALCCTLFPSVCNHSLQLHIQRAIYFSTAVKPAHAGASTTGIMRQYMSLQSTPEIAKNLKQKSIWTRIMSHWKTLVIFCLSQCMKMEVDENTAVIWWYKCT